MKYPNIDAERARLGLSNEKFAELLGVSRKTVFNWLASGNIPQSKLVEMTVIFGCSADYLLGRARVSR